MKGNDEYNLKVVFIYISIAIALLVTIISGSSAAFAIINYFLMPDSFTWWNFRGSVYGSLPSSIAFLSIAFLTLMALSRIVRDDIAIDHQRTVWYRLCQAIVMVILTLSLCTVLFVSALLIEGVLSGDISWAHFLKLVFMLGIGAMTFYYYRGVLRHVWQSHRKEKKMLVVTVSALVILLLVLGVAVVRPLTQRSVAETYEALDHLKTVSREVNVFFSEKKYLPADLSVLEYIKHGYVVDDGSVTYEKTGYASYRLCAEFEALPRGTDLSEYPYDDFEVKETGTNCFVLSAQ